MAASKADGGGGGGGGGGGDGGKEIGSLALVAAKVRLIGSLVRPYRTSGIGAPFRDFLTGIITGLIYWPVALGHAALAGTPPSSAIGTAVLPSIVYALTGSLPLLALQTGSTVALCMKELVERAEEFGMTPSELACVMALFVGIMQLVLGVLDMAAITELFSQPLLRGRTIAMAVMVCASQMKTILGLKVTSSSDSIPLVQYVDMAIAVPDAHWQTVVTSLGLIVLLILLRRFGKWAGKPPGAACESVPLHIPTAEYDAHAMRDRFSGRSNDSDGGNGSPLGTSRFFRATSSLGDGFDGVSSAASAAAHSALEAVRRPTCRKVKCCMRRTLRLIGRVLSAAGGLLVLIIGWVIYNFNDDCGMKLISAIEVPTFSPQVHFPGTPGRIVSLVQAAALVAFITLGAHLTAAERFRRPQDFLEPRRELLSSGLANMSAVLAGGMPTMPNLACSMAVKNCTGGLAVIGNAAGHLLAFVIAAKVPVLQKVPACAVASILFVEFFPMILEAPRDIKHLVQLARATQGKMTLKSLVSSDLGIYFSAFACPLVFGLINGSVIAILLELLFAVSRFAGAGYVHLGRIQDTDMYDELGVPDSEAQELANVCIVRWSGARWFGNVATTTRILRRERAARGRDRAVKCVVVDMSMVAFFDETALVHYKREWKGWKEKVVVTNACAKVREQLDSSGILTFLNQPRDTLTDLHRAVVFAEDLAQQMIEEGKDGTGKTLAEACTESKLEQVAEMAHTSLYADLEEEIAEALGGEDEFANQRLQQGETGAGKGSGSLPKLQAAVPAAESHPAIPPLLSL